MKVLLDNDVILDYLLQRAPFAVEAAVVWQANQQKLFTAYISAITPVNVFYIARKTLGANLTRQAVQTLLAEFAICPITDSILQLAFTSGITDYEDAVQHTSAVAVGLDAIVTRNLKDYKAATLPVYAPIDFLSTLILSDDTTSSPP